MFNLFGCPKRYAGRPAPIPNKVGQGQPTATPAPAQRLSDNGAMRTAADSVQGAKRAPLRWRGDISEDFARDTA